MTNDKVNKNLYKKMLRIRMVEEKLLDLFSEGKIFGTTHTSIGEEAIAVAALNNISNSDVVFSNHRCHGHYLAYGGDLKKFFAEIMGKETGVCGGRGGSQHLHYKNFFSNGIQGGIVGNATGIAFGKKMMSESGIVYCFLGDGTLGEGLIYESFNFASKQNLKIMYIVTNNQYAMSTNVNESVAGKITNRAKAFGINYSEHNSNNVFELLEGFSKAKLYIEDNSKPFFVNVNTYRLAPHSKGDDTRKAEEINEFWKKEPLLLFENIISPEDESEIRKDILVEINDCLAEVESDNSAQIDLETVEDYILNHNLKPNNEYFSKSNEKVLNRINEALHSLLVRDPKVFLLGEDLRDPYGGAFKVTKGLSTLFPHRVINTPISEAGITSWAVGSALIGSKPIVEIMFGDFITLTIDQIINHATKYRWMYNKTAKAPIILRTPMGGKRGYGATHSQSIEKILIGIPDLILVALNSVVDPQYLYNQLHYQNEFPSVVIENKSLYSRNMMTHNKGKLNEYFYSISDDLLPVVNLYRFEDENPEISIIAYGDMIHIALEVAEYFMVHDEMMINIVCVSQLSPIQSKSIYQFIQTSKYVFTIEEGTKNGNWGDSVISSLTYLDSIKNNNGFRKYIGLSSKNINIPIEKYYENEVLLNSEQVIQSIKEVFR